MGQALDERRSRQAEESGMSRRPVREKTVAMSRLCRKAGCHREGDYSRGLCESCYRMTAKYVADGVTTWARLEQQGKVERPDITLKEWLLS